MEGLRWFQPHVWCFERNGWKSHLENLCMASPAQWSQGIWIFYMADQGSRSNCSHKETLHGPFSWPRKSAISFPLYSIGQSGHKPDQIQEWGDIDPTTWMGETKEFAALATFLWPHTVISPFNHPQMQWNLFMQGAVEWQGLLSQALPKRQSAMLSFLPLCSRLPPGAAQFWMPHSYLPCLRRHN